MVSQLELVARLVMAAALGSVIGFERERLSWAAGLRTHMLVCVGSALIMIVSAFGFQDALGGPHVVLDPSRVAAQVVSGIGFLGAGTILLRGEVIRGLTTAASLWSVAAIGLAIGGGLYTAAVAATLIILLILAGLKPIESKYFASKRSREFRLTAGRGALTMVQLNKALGARSRLVRQFVVQHLEGVNDVDEITISFNRLSIGEVSQVLDQLQAIPGVREVTEVDRPL
ncbi:putative Mg(2+) transport ATPase [Variovorax sp. SRS16]|uniref:MgtC/SapB family protein n=1 Tax=Variovorax sp. SRS16 TaxID=282217 RepID=UPI0013191515|nr:MgtC/SapB family protein [Variovorax sp. SRS16]VTU28744.1 putative Mg(2+) transport ATPase [Variovorax sp. SRS16]